MSWVGMEGRSHALDNGPITLYTSSNVTKQQSDFFMPLFVNTTSSPFSKKKLKFFYFYSRVILLMYHKTEYGKLLRKKSKPAGGGNVALVVLHKLNLSQPQILFHCVYRSFFISLLSEKFLILSSFLAQLFILYIYVIICCGRVRSSFCACVCGSLLSNTLDLVICQLCSYETLIIIIYRIKCNIYEIIYTNNAILFLSLRLFYCLIIYQLNLFKQFLLLWVKNCKREKWMCNISHAFYAGVYS